MNTMLYVKNGATSRFKLETFRLRIEISYIMLNFQNYNIVVDYTV